GRRLPRPQRQRVVEASSGPDPLAAAGSPLPLVVQGLKAGHVQFPVTCLDQVPTRAGGDSAMIGIAQGLPQPLHIVLRRHPRRGRPTPLPPPLHPPLNPYPPPAPHNPPS